MQTLLQDILAHSVDKIISFTPRLFVSILIFLIFYLVAWIVSKLAIKLGRSVDNDKAKVFRLIGSIIKVTTVIIGLITALGTLGVDVTAMVAGLGLSGFALGFALKDALSNMLAGILILFYHPYRNGDTIKVTGCEGIVTDINLRYTKLETPEKEFLIPNSTCFTNWVAVSKKDSD